MPAAPTACCRKSPPPPPPLHIAEQQLALPLRLPKRTKHKPPSLGTSAQRATLRIVVSAVGEPLVADLNFSQKAWRSTCSALVVRTPISPGWCGGRGACLKSIEHVILPSVTFVMPRRLPPDPQASCTSPPPPPRRGPRPPAKGGWGRASTAPTLRCWLRGRPAEFHALACSHGYISPQQGHPMPGLAGLRPSNPPKPALKALRSRRKQVSTGETGALVGTKRRRSATQLRLSNGSAAPEGIWVTLYRCSHATAKRMRKALVQTLASGNAIAGVKQSRMQGEERTLCFCMHVALTLATTHATNRRKLQVFRANALPHCALNLSV